MAKRVLFLSHRLPYPPTSGGGIKRWRLVEHLSRHFELGLAVLHTRGEKDAREDLKGRIDFAEFFVRKIDRQRTFANLLRSYSAGTPLAVYRNSSSHFAGHVARVAERYDVLLLDSCLMAQYVPEDFGGRVVLHTHNAEHELLEQYARLGGNVVRRSIARKEARRMREYEQAACARADVLLVARGDMAALASLGTPRGKMLGTLHLGDETLLDAPDLQFSETDRRIAFVGTLSWQPNLEGIRWFERAVWRKLRARDPSLELRVVGEGGAEALGFDTSPASGIEAPGFVDSLADAYGRSRLFIAPMRFGSGMSVKVVDALSRGLPVVTTPTIAAGLGEAAPCLSVASGAREFAAEVTRLLGDRAAWEQQRNRSREYAREHFRWAPVLAAVDQAVNG